VNESELPRLRRLARELGVPPAALRDALECGLFSDDETPAAWASDLRQMRRMMDHLGVNAPGAALLVRMHHDLQVMQRHLDQLNRLEARWLDEAEDGFWYDLLS
jgi:hypothetical protein